MNALKEVKFGTKDRASCAVGVSDAHFALLKTLVPQPHPKYSARKKVPTVENMVVKASFNGEIDLVKMCRLFQNVDYKPSRFAAMVLRIFPPRSTCLMFSNGRMVLTGVNSIETAAVAIMRILFMLYEAGFRPICNGMRVANIVCSGLVGHDVDVNKLSEVYSTTTVYCPGMFAGCVYEVDIYEVLQELLETKMDSGVTVNPDQKKTKKRKVRMLVFQGGSVVSMGLKSHREMEAVCDSMMQKLSMCRMNGSVSTNMRAQERINAKTKDIPIRHNKRTAAHIHGERVLQNAIDIVTDPETKNQLRGLQIVSKLEELNLDEETESAQNKKARNKCTPHKEEAYQDMPMLAKK